MTSPLPALHAIEREEGVAVLLAIESGSRAWGFPSPDSDWDVRFVYARTTRWHLRVSPGRDVIERTLPGDLDVSGWDVRKTLGLLLRGNCTIREWLCSPIQYRAEPAFVGALRALADRVPARAAALNHYASLVLKVKGTGLEREVVRYKTYLYAIRPALVLRWLRMHPDGTPPMDVPALLAGVGLPADVAAALDDLLARKAAASEVGVGQPIPVLSRFIDDELERAQAGRMGASLRQMEEDLAREADDLLARSAMFADEVCAAFA